MSVALIKFTQNAVAGTAGQAYFGATGLAVTVDNDVNTGVASWQIDVVYVPHGSSISLGTLAFNNNSGTPTTTFTPDVPGAYRIVLYTWDSINRPGSATSIDIRNFGVKDANGFYRPAPQIWPRPLPPTASGETGNKPDENNFGGQSWGWVGDGTDGLMDQRLAYPMRADALRELGGPTVLVMGTVADGLVLARSGTQITGSNFPSGIAAGTQTGVSGTIAFSNSNGISFGMSGSTRITASYTVPSTAGLISAVNFSAGTTSNNLSAVTFSNSNNVSFGLNGSTITGSVATSLTNVNLSAGTTSNNLSAFVFSNSNNVSFGLNGSTVTATVTVPAQTNQTVGLYALGNTTQNSSTTLDARTISFNGLGIVTVGYSNGSVQVSATTAAQTNQTVGLYALGNTTQNSSTTLDARTLSFNGLGIVTVGYSNGSIQVSATTAAQSNQTEGRYAIGNTTGQSSSSTFDARTMSISGAGLISVGYSGNALVISASAAQTVQTQNIVVPSAGTQTATSGTVVWANSNGISFGMSGSSQITASYTVPSTAGLISAVNVSAGTTSNNLSALTFANGNGVSFGLNASTVTASVAAQTNQTLGLFAVGNTTQNSSTTLDARTLSFNGLGGITVGYSNGSIQLSGPTSSSLSGTGAVSIVTNGGTVSIGAPVRKVSYLSNGNNPWQTNFSISNASLSLQHFNPRADITASQANLLMALSGNTNSSGALTVSMAIYTMNGSTMSLASSDSRQLSWTSGSATTASSVYGGISGTRYRTVALGNWSISAGDYMIGMWYRTTNDGTWRAFGVQGPTIVGAVDANETNHYLPGFSTSSFTTGMIASVNVTDTNFVRTGFDALQQPGIVFLGSF